MVQIFIQMFSLLQRFFYVKNIFHHKNMSVHYTFLHSYWWIIVRVFQFLTKFVYYCLLEDKWCNMVVLNIFFLT